jgi:hypothetical protein
LSHAYTWTGGDTPSISESLFSPGRHFNGLLDDRSGSE